jgi:two-component system sensor histidine kinase AlgZ
MPPDAPSPPHETDFPATATRPASLWPASALDTSSTFDPSRFDPLADERARIERQVREAFDLCHPALALRAVLGVQAVLAVGALAGADTFGQWGARQAAAAFVGAAGTLLWLVAVCALARPLRRARTLWRGLGVGFAGVAAAWAGWLPLAWFQLIDAVAPLRLAGVGVAGAAMALVAWGWLELRSRLWHPVHTQAKLAELQSRIRPHFLFNALNTALALVRVDPERAESVLEDLSALFRVALAETGAAVTLAEEIELAQRYLAIEQVRFGSRIKVSWDVDPRTGNAKLPPLALQPLVENAVRHGVEPAPRGGQVWVRAHARRAQVVLEVINTLPDEPSTPGHGIALANVRERLRLLHDLAAQLDTWQEGGRYHARVVLPMT